MGRKRIWRDILEDISLTTGRLDTLLLGLGQGLNVTVHGVLVGG